MQQAITQPVVNTNLTQKGISQMLNIGTKYALTLMTISMA